MYIGRYSIEQYRLFLPSDEGKWKWNSLTAWVRRTLYNLATCFSRSEKVTIISIKKEFLKFYKSAEIEKVENLKNINDVFIHHISLKTDKIEKRKFNSWYNYSLLAIIEKEMVDTPEKAKVKKKKPPFSGDALKLHLWTRKSLFKKENDVEESEAQELIEGQRLLPNSAISSLEANERRSSTEETNVQEEKEKSTAIKRKGQALNTTALKLKLWPQRSVLKPVENQSEKVNQKMQTAWRAAMADDTWKFPLLGEPRILKNKIKTDQQSNKRDLPTTEP